MFESSNKAIYPRAPEKVFRTPPPPPLQGLLGRGHAGMNLLSGCSSVLEPCSWLRPHSSDSVRSDKTSQSQRESLAPSELYVHVLLISVLQKCHLCRFGWLSGAVASLPWVTPPSPLTCTHCILLTFSNWPRQRLSLQLIDVLCRFRLYTVFFTPIGHQAYIFHPCCPTWSLFISPWRIIK